MAVAMAAEPCKNPLIGFCIRPSVIRSMSLQAYRLATCSGKGRGTQGETGPASGGPVRWSHPPWLLVSSTASTSEIS